MSLGWIGRSSAALIAISLSLASTAQDPATIRGSPQIHALLDKLVPSKKAAVGDPVVARTTEPTRLSDGTELPKGTQILGKITELKLKPDKQGPSRLGLLFRTAQPKNGKEITLMLALVSLAPRFEASRVDLTGTQNMTLGGHTGRISQTEGPTSGSASGDSLSKASGVRGGGGPQTMLPGTCYLPNMMIENYSAEEPGTIIQSTKTIVYLNSGTRLLLLVR